MTTFITTPEIANSLQQSITVAESVGNTTSHQEGAPTGSSVSVTSDNISTPEMSEPSVPVTSNSTTYDLSSVKAALTATLVTLQGTLHELKGAQRNIYLVLAVLLADWLGNAVYNAIPLVGGLPTAIGTVYLCSLVLRTKREEAIKLLREYIG
ncbi:hypothetical protein [Microcoleus phage My-WqHQDG]|nr:hypothetical protein [Microcoleus phage My-WqHQDG]